MPDKYLFKAESRISWDVKIPLETCFQYGKFESVAAIIQISEWCETIGFLSFRERRCMNSLRHPQRRKEWLASRIIAKYLFLTQGRQSASDLVRNDCPRFQILSPDYLIHFPPEEYRQIEILTPDPINRTPHLFCKEEDISDRVSISISHTGGWAAAALSMNEPIGIDMELVTSRSDVFARGCFLETERSWTHLNSDTIKIGADWLYTFLWTLKEASFKAGMASTWRPKEIEVILPSPIPAILRPHTICPLIYVMAFSHVRIRTTLSQWFCHAACIGTKEWLLTTINSIKKEV